MKDSLLMLSSSEKLANRSIPVFCGVWETPRVVLLDVSWIADNCQVESMRIDRDGKVLLEGRVPQVYLKQNALVAKSVVCFDSSFEVRKETAERLNGECLMILFGANGLECGRGMVKVVKQTIVRQEDDKGRSRGQAQSDPPPSPSK